MTTFQNSLYIFHISGSQTIFLDKQEKKISKLNHKNMGKPYFLYKKIIFILMCVFVTLVGHLSHDPPIAQTTILPEIAFFS